MGIRKSATKLTPAERDAFLAALLTLKNTIANPGDPPADQINIYDQFVGIHRAVWSVNYPGGGPNDYAHGDSAFLPWHREYLIRFEQALQAVDPNVTLPYWDWTDHAGVDTILFQDTYMSPNGGPGGVGGGDVVSGYFAFNAPGVLPAWWPVGLPGLRVRASLDDGLGTTLRRFLDAFSDLAEESHVTDTLDEPNFENPDGFRPQLEGGTRMHNRGHTWMSGHMTTMSSPNDAMFWLHHCNVDRLWAMWQIDGHQGAAWYPAAGRSEGHNLNDLMWPWVGATAGYSSNNVPADVILPDFTAEPSRTPNDLLDHRALGYAYDTEVILGVALDQTGSMTGMTPDPLTGMPPDITKWEAAKQGVSFLLQDCEAAYSSGLAYITAGVQTFRTTGGANVYTKVFVGTPYGIIKTGAAYSQATFDANIAALNPSGGTPLAGAITNTETDLVRPPFADLPAGEIRYMSILTDGIETTSPLLATLAEPEYPETIIFGMGFGTGGGWNGVDFATIQTIVNKGRAAPAGVTQVYHGENAGVIDKFYADTIAATLGFGPSVDPRYELFEGEHVMTPFDATHMDQAFMITATGFNFVDDDWEFIVMPPNEQMHMGPSESPYLITYIKRNGRASIFIQRNGATDAEWIGRWHLMSKYKPHHPLQAMVMLHPWQHMLPTGAPPIRGPLYQRFNQPATQRKAARLIPQAKTQPAISVQAGARLAANDPGEAMTVAINIYTKSSLQSSMVSVVPLPYAGHSFEVLAALNDYAAAQYGQMRVIGRMVAPAHSTGNAYTDLDTIPVNRRPDYVQENQLFNEIQYLADYETLKPTTFPVTDTEVIFEEIRPGLYRAVIDQTPFPGVYHLAIHVEGTVTYPGRRPERITRVINTQVPIGILPDREKSAPTLHWTAPNKFTVTVTPTDKLGNVASPGRLSGLGLTMNQQQVQSNHRNTFTGSHQLDVSLDTDSSPSVDGRSIGGQPLDLKLNIGQGTMRVNLPQVVGDSRTNKAYGAGTPEAMKIPIAFRSVYQGISDAENAGFEVDTEGLSEEDIQSLDERYRVRIVLEKVRILDDQDAWGKGEFSFKAIVRPSESQSESQVTRMPEKRRFYKISDTDGENELVLNTEIFNGVIDREELEVRIEAVEYDFWIFTKNLASHVRKLSGDPESWTGSYRPGDEKTDPEEMGDWEVFYTVDVEAIN